MPATASVPPWSRARSATGTSSPAGANSTAESSGSGGPAAGGPAEAAPSSRASRCAAAERVSTCTRAPWAIATCATTCADAPNP